MSSEPTWAPERRPGHLEMTDLYAKFALEHPEIALLIEEHKAVIQYHLTHDQKPREVTHKPTQTEIGKHFETWIQDPENRKKFDALMPSDKFLIVSALNEDDIAFIESSPTFINDIRLYVWKKPNHASDFRRGLQLDWFLDDKAKITPEWFDQIKRILGMN